MFLNQRLKAFVSTTQPDKAREFYTKKLGLKLLSEDSFGLEFEANGAHLRISFVEKLTPQPFTVLGWDTTDIVSTIKVLNEKGISFE
jgi:catechol 2,3-dioxygenase-like lactoylglutathione lyase family enzyme